MNSISRLFIVPIALFFINPSHFERVIHFSVVVKLEVVEYHTNFNAFAYLNFKLA